jgi:hypothetical protein
LEEIGQEYGLTRERIRQIESRAMAKIRYDLQKQLKGYEPVRFYDEVTRKPHFKKPQTLEELPLAGRMPTDETESDTTPNISERLKSIIDEWVTRLARDYEHPLSTMTMLQRLEAKTGTLLRNGADAFEVMDLLYELDNGAMGEKTLVRQWRHDEPEEASVLVHELRSGIRRNQSEVDHLRSKLHDKSAYIARLEPSHPDLEWRVSQARELQTRLTAAEDNLAMQLEQLPRLTMEEPELLKRIKLFVNEWPHSPMLLPHLFSNAERLLVEVKRKATENNL